MTTWFTSDLHFEHKRICEFTQRKDFTSQENHTEWLTDLWNSQVAKGDIVWHLGDFSFSRNADEIESVLKQLNGVKHFIKGNHDDRKVLDELKKRNAINWWGDYKETKIEKHAVCLFHFPMAVWHKQHYGSWHLFGHSHGCSTDTGGKCLDVGLDSAYKILGEHKFFSSEDVLEYMQQRKVQVNDHHTHREGEMK
jgi:calcineurin-like phosphoesterase family protein